MSPSALVRLVPLAATLVLALSATAASAVDDRPQAAQAQAAGKPLTSDELRKLHTGADMAGCYVNRPREPTWTERMAPDGRLYDLEKDATLVGSWWVDKGGVICFRYDDREPGPHCFTGRRRDGYLDYYSTLDGALTATTDCGAPVA